MLQFAPLILLAIVFYFILIRPQQQRAKQQARLLSTLKAGDKVVTSSGIVGVVITVKDKATPPAVSIRSADAKFEVTKASVVEIIADSSASES
jgi:preprotein translocase subunit YajC